MPKEARETSRGGAGGGRGRGSASGRGRRGRGGRGGSTSRPASYVGEPGRKVDESAGYGFRREAAVRGGRGTRKSRIANPVFLNTNPESTEDGCNLQSSFPPVLPRNINPDNKEFVVGNQETFKMPRSKKGKPKGKSNRKQAFNAAANNSTQHINVTPTSTTEQMQDPSCIKKLPPLRKPEFSSNTETNASSNGPDTTSVKIVSPVFASQDVRFKQKITPSSTPVKVSLSKPVIRKESLQSLKLSKSLANNINQRSSAKEVVDSPANPQEVTILKKMPMYVSQATGLTVLSVSSCYPGYVFNVADRAKLVRCIPGVVIINTAKKGDGLVLGVDMEHEELSRMLPQVEKELKTKNWTISSVDTSMRDTFSYFAGWKLLPRVDKSGMFQLIVSLKSQGWKSKDGEMKKRNQLLDMVKEFNIAKIVHGEGETILLVGHVLECVAYSDCIRKVFTMERRHTWRTQSTSSQRHDSPTPGQERHFWVKVQCPELGNLSTAHKQYSVFHQLSAVGKVIQLEHLLFGAADNYLVVYDFFGDVKKPVLGQQFCLMELWPDSLPDHYIPTYGVDNWGFYSVSGKFPENLSNDTRNKFAEDMKTVGAVGFKSGDTEDRFSLHFVNSRCIEKIGRCEQFTSFSLTILSSLVRKAHSDKKLRKLVPAILKYKELKLAEKIIPQENVKKMEQSDDLKLVKQDVENKDESGEIKSHQEVTAKQAAMNMSSSKVLPVTKDKKSKIANSANIEKIVRKKGKEVRNQDSGLVTDSNTVINSVMELSESELLQICWKKEGSLSSYLKNLCKFFGMVLDVAVAESEEILLKFPSKKKLDGVLIKMCNERTNSVEKLKASSQVLKLEGSKFYKDKFGIVLCEKKATIAQLKKDFAKFGQVEIEVRSQVFVIWFASKLSFFKALTDRSLDYVLVPSVQNAKFHEVATHSKAKGKLQNCKKDGVIDEVLVDDVSRIKSQVWKLCEREVFGFIWQSSKGKIHIRDDQVISRQLTTFIKTVSCHELSADEDGLLVSFSCQLDLSNALSKYCPEVPTKEQLSSLSRKFTLLPFKGFFGLFSAKRVKPNHFIKFGVDCKVRNCGIWFSDKVALFTVLRDPFIVKNYPALFIDCRNIFILSSNKAPPPAQAIQDKPAASSALKSAVSTSAVRIAVSTLKAPGAAVLKPNASSAFKSSSSPIKPVANPLKPAVSALKPATSSVLKTAGTSVLQPCPKYLKSPGVMTRSANARLLSNNEDDAVVSQPVSKQDDNIITIFASKSSEPAAADPAILTAVSSPLLLCQPTPPPSCPLLTALLPPGKSGLVQGKFGRVGKFGHIPSARLVRTGYKQSKMPLKANAGAEADLFLEDKDCYRSKDVKEAAKLISNILQGKMSEVTGVTLKEIKMKRVEYFLKDKLGVDYVLAKGESDAKNMSDKCVNDKNDRNGEVTNDPDEGISSEDKTNEDELPNEEFKEDAVDETVIKDYAVMDKFNENCEKSNEKEESPLVVANDDNEENLLKPVETVSEQDDVKAKILKNEARRKFENEALIFPEVFLKEETKEFTLLKDKNNIMLQNNFVDPIAVKTVTEKPAAVDEKFAAVVETSTSELTPDLIGLFTVTLPVPLGTDLNLLTTLQDDIIWFDTPVSVLSVDMTEVYGGAMIEVKMKDKDMTMAVLTGLMHKYPGLEGDKTGSHADIVADKETGLYTLCFTDTHRKRYKATMVKFRKYSKQLPVISRGLGVDQVLVGFHVKEEAVEAFRQNLESEEFPELHVAAGSRT